MTSYKQKHIDISKITSALLSTTITVNGWVRSLRIQATVAFIELHDGSTSKTIQLITEDLSIIEKLKVLCIGSSLSILGEVVKHPTKEDQVEIKIKEILYLGKIHDPLTYILNAKKTSLETLRDHMDVRVKTRTFTAVFRIRAALSKATHDFWHNLGFHHLNPNIITTGDCEGGGEVFTLTTLLNNDKGVIIFIIFLQYGSILFIFFNKISVSFNNLESMSSGIISIYFSNNILSSHFSSNCFLKCCK